MTEACPHCPFRDRTDGLNCPRWPTDHTRFCEWVDPDSPGRVAGGAEALVRLVLSRQRAGRAEPEPDAETVGRTPFADSYLNVLSCDYRDQPDTSRDRGCGCADVRACGLGKGMVNLADCLQCVKG
jgi:hypothetical protein